MSPATRTADMCTKTIRRPGCSPRVTCFSWCGITSCSTGSHLPKRTLWIPAPRCAGRWRARTCGRSWGAMQLGHGSALSSTSKWPLPLASS
eukprot:11154986-Lingulodinium_polyedra.AAC.1